MNASSHIVVVDDEPEIRRLVQDYFEPQGYRVTTAANGEALRRVLANDHVDLVILDLLLPGEDGLELARALGTESDVGIIILTGQGEVVDRVVGLEIGADDYVAKPFELRELLARVRSVLRRITPASPAVPASEDRANEVARFVDWRLEFGARRLVSPEGEEVPLTTAEFGLLSALVKSPNQVLSRDRLLDLVHRPGTERFDRSIDVLILRLRRKIEAHPQRPALIKTVRGGGYMFTPAVEIDRR